MSRLYVDRIHDDEGEEVLSSYGGKGGVRIPIVEGSVSGDSSDDGDSSSVSDCESVISGNGISEHSKIKIEPKGLVRLDESERLYGIIGKKFVSRLSEIGIKAQIRDIQRNLFNASEIAHARLNSFQIFTKAVEKKIGGDANIKYAWFGASKDEIDNIIVHGFGYDNIRKDNSFGQGVVLSADHSPLESVESAIVDNDGIKHILLCRVILGKSEAVNRDSSQSHPSSEEFQSGVDDLEFPKKFIVWSSQMNTHILPEFVVSFKALTTVNRGSKAEGIRLDKPVSPWIPIPNLIAALSKILPSKAIKEITQFRCNYIGRKISRRDMIRGIREVTGDHLLLTVLKDFTEQRQLNVSGKFESISSRLK